MHQNRLRSLQCSSRPLSWYKGDLLLGEREGCRKRKGQRKGNVGEERGGEGGEGREGLTCVSVNFPWNNMVIVVAVNGESETELPGLKTCLKLYLGFQCY